MSDSFRYSTRRLVFRSLIPMAVSVLWFGLPCLAESGSIRVFKLADGKSFQMGRVHATRILYPDMGARRFTLNYVPSGPGDEFSQHVHDNSDDTFLVLQGQVDVRQGNSRRPLVAGQAAFVPAGQVHGTITTGTGEAILISFQAPPDLALYTGARDSSRQGNAPPKGVITPGAVKIIDFAKQNGFFTHPAMGSAHAAAAHRKLRTGEKFSTAVGAGGEEMFFVWKGAISARSKEATYKAGEKDTVYITGPSTVEVRNEFAGETMVVQVQSPPQSR